MEPAELVHLVTEPTRHRLLQALQEAEMTVGSLTEAVAGEQSNISHHLRILREAGLVKARRRGRTQRYRLADAAVAELLARLQEVGGSLERVAYFAGLEIPLDPAFHGYG